MEYSEYTRAIHHIRYVGAGDGTDSHPVTLVLETKLALLMNVI